MTESVGAARSPLVLMRASTCSIMSVAAAPTVVSLIPHSEAADPEGGTVCRYIGSISERASRANSL